VNFGPHQYRIERGNDTRTTAIAKQTVRAFVNAINF